MRWLDGAPLTIAASVKVKPDIPRESPIEQRTNNQDRPADGVGYRAIGDDGPWKGRSPDRKDQGIVAS